MTTLTPQQQHAPAPAVAVPPTRTVRAAYVSPRFRHEQDWPWLTAVGALRKFDFQHHTITNQLRRLGFATAPYRRWQYAQTMWRLRDRDLVYLFSCDIGIGMTGAPASLMRHPKRIYVGFTQDGHWSNQRIEQVGRGLRACDAVCVFTEQERQIYVERYGLESQRVHVVPIHTDDTQGYRQYDGASPVDGPFVLAMGLTNRVFEPVARACRTHGIPLVILTRPHHANDDLDELARLGATIVTDADQPRAFSYLKHAALSVMLFNDPTLPGGFTTVMNAMFLGTPFVVSDAIGIGEHVVDGQNGFVVPHQDQDALDAAIAELWNNAELRNRFEAAGRQLADERHSLESAAEAFHELGCRVLAE